VSWLEEVTIGVVKDKLSTDSPCARAGGGAWEGERERGAEVVRVQCGQGKLQRDGRNLPGLSGGNAGATGKRCCVGEALPCWRRDSDRRAQAMFSVRTGPVCYGDPAMDVEISSQHNDLVTALYGVRDRFNQISRDERLILESAIQLLEYLPIYKDSVDHELEWTPENLKLMAARPRPKRQTKIRWTVDDFERLICSGGFELHDGKLVPRF